MYAECWSRWPSPCEVFPFVSLRCSASCSRWPPRRAPTRAASTTRACCSPGPLEDAAVDAGSGEAGEADGPTDPCNHALAPARPTGADAPDIADFVEAVRTLDFGLDLDGGPPLAMGLDIDGVCTCPPAETCRAPVMNATHCDEDGGRDNGTGVLLRGFSDLSGGIINQDSVNKRLERGEYSLLIRVRHYNGKPDDPSVEVSVYLSNGLEQPSADGGAVPSWNGTDRFTVDTGSAFGGSDEGALIPNYVDTKAYVVGGSLVTTQEQVPLFLGSSGLGFFTMKLTNVTLVMRLAPDGSTFRVAAAEVAGRWTTKELLQTMSNFRSPFDDKYICPGSQIYNDAKQLICKNADVAANPKNDRTGAPCEALSVGFRLTASPVALGSVTPNGAAAPNCDAGPDDCN